MLYKYIFPPPLLFRTLHIYTHSTYRKMLDPATIIYSCFSAYGMADEETKAYHCTLLSRFSRDIPSRVAKTRRIRRERQPPHVWRVFEKPPFLNDPFLCGFFIQAMHIKASVMRVGRGGHLLPPSLLLHFNNINRRTRIACTT